MVYDEAVDILVIEGNDSKRVAIVMALKKSIPDIRIVAIHNGVEARALFFACNFEAFGRGPGPPKLVLLDLGLPFSDSFSLVGEIRTQDAEGVFRLTPVVVFTDSEFVEDTAEQLLLLREQLQFETYEASRYSDQCGKECAMAASVLPGSLLNSETERAEK